MKTTQQGLSLLEVWLVLVIAIVITYLSIQQYVIYRRDMEVRQLQYNVDILFQGLANYFRAYCAQSSFNSFYADQYFPVTLDMLQGYLPATLMESPLVANDMPLGGYVLQFNQVQTETSPPAPLINPLPYRSVETYPDNQSVPTGYVTVWQAQVAVRLKNPDTVEQYQALLSADCLSSLQRVNGNVSVAPCSQATERERYVVFTRQPSLASTKFNSVYWPSKPTVLQFTQMYNVAPILLLTDGTQTADQYYICGS
ncbi:MAG TPA: hypothetical protein VHZ76_02675 [Gammaproteobacteria bacterium]|jgi:hypothetical protein|nr:hypothetical protein [Gammaproteobacteria bacterium]